MTQHYEDLYDESIRLIDRNPNLTTSAIPNHLLYVWIYNGLIVADPPFEFLFAAAIYKYANDKYGDSNLDPAADRDRFERLQHILAVEFVCRQVGATLRPRKIFDFKHETDPIHVDIKRHQMKKFQALAAQL
ncbi:MAG: hypothetical protein SNH13_02245, partial [Rikenellaceae bacterium]